MFWDLYDSSPPPLFNNSGLFCSPVRPANLIWSERGISLPILFSSLFPYPEVMVPIYQDLSLKKKDLSLTVYKK